MHRALEECLHALEEAPSLLCFCHLHSDAAAEITVWYIHCAIVSQPIHNHTSLSIWFVFISDSASPYHVPTSVLHQTAHRYFPSFFPSSIWQQRLLTCSRKTLIYLILTLNHAYPDYDFSQLKADNFCKEPGLSSVEEAVDTHLLEISRVRYSSRSSSHLPLIKIPRACMISSILSLQSMSAYPQQPQCPRLSRCAALWKIATAHAALTETPRAGSGPTCLHTNGPGLLPGLQGKSFSF